MCARVRANREPRAREHLFTCACAIVRVHVCMYERLCIYMYAWSLAVLGTLWFLDSGTRHSR
jgi:hypothetical protein